MYNLIALFVDTNIKIHNFVPNFEDDHSGSEGEKFSEIQFFALKLFRPFIIGETFDLFLDEYHDEDLTRLVSSERYLKAGRPLVSQSESHDFLKRKLLCGSNTFAKDSCLGIMLCRVAAFVCPRHNMAIDLVASHMSTLLACGKEQKGILSSYVAEPKLAMAAAELWNKSEIFFTCHGAPALQSAFMSGALSQGIRGEIVGQIILLLAFDAACAAASVGYGGCVNLVSVLEHRAEAKF